MPNNEKKLQINTDVYSIKNIMQKYDLEGNGKISQEEMDVIERVITLESKKAKEADRDKREDAQRRMAWFSLAGMLLYPSGILLAEYLGLTHAANLLSDIAPVYFVSVAGLVAAFFSTQAWTTRAQEQNFHKSDNNI
jgi:hypothetical protein